MARTPDEILTDIDTVAATSVDGPDLRNLMWEVIEDVRSSLRLAIDNTQEPLTDGQKQEIWLTIEDYVVNNYGDD